MEKRALIAVALSILILVTYQQWLAKKYPVLQRAGDVKATMVQGRAAKSPIEMPRAAGETDEEEYIVETDKYLLTFSNLGGSIKRIELKEFYDSQTGEPFKLVDLIDPLMYVGALKINEKEMLCSAAYKMSKSEDNISFAYSTPTLEINKRYKVDKSNDYIELYVILSNRTQVETRLDSTIVAAANLELSDSMAKRYLRVGSKVDGKIFMDRRDTARTGDVSWVSLTSKYFCILQRPYQLGRKAIVKVVEKDKLMASMENAPLTIPSSGEAVQQYLFYIGPLDVNRLKALNLGLEETINYGIFDGISKLLVKTLGFFHKIFRNWGIAIICLTFLVNVILYPLTRKSYKSMRAMQELQPHMDELRTLHKNNPQKLNKELMELYRKYKVNPLGGCFPLLLQMPIFIALYHGLMRSIELKGANFLWIKDLSKPDAVRLPFSMPFLGNSINILPILMMIAMIIQQKISTPHRTTGMSSEQKQQQNMMLMMPIIFVVIFYALPSGLVLYWLVNTTLMVLHQYHIKRAAVTIAEKS